MWRNARGDGEDGEETRELIQRRRQMSIWRGNRRRGAGAGEGGGEEAAVKLN